jgi:hypothetical protein
VTGIAALPVRVDVQDAGVTGLQEGALTCATVAHRRKWRGWAFSEIANG